MKPLRHVVLYEWVRLTGNGTVSLRMLPLAFGLMATVMIFIISKDLLGMPLGLFSPPLFAF